MFLGNKRGLGHAPAHRAVTAMMAIGPCGKGGKGRFGQAQAIQTLEASFLQKCEILWHSLMDLNLASEAPLDRGWRELKSVRSRLIQSYSAAMQPQLIRPTILKPTAKTLPKPAKNQGDRNQGAKEKLAQACQLLCGRSLVKGEIVYEVQDEEGQFCCAVTLVPLNITFQGLPAETGKTAETNAAEAALEALRDQLAPLEAERAQRKAESGKTENRGQPKLVKQEVPVLAGTGKGGKGKESHQKSEGSMAKEKLQQGCQLLCGRSLVKGEIAYECLQGEQGEFTATVTLHALEQCPSFQGASAADQRMAECLAAEAALQGLHSQLEEKREARKRELRQIETRVKEKAKVAEAGAHQKLIKREPLPFPPPDAPGKGVKGKGKKRKGPEEVSQSSGRNDGPKEKLAQACQLLIGRSLTKGELVYDVQDDGLGQFVATVTLPAYDPNTTHLGSPGATQREAEFSAAAVAMAALHDEIETAHQAKKARKALQSEAM